MDRSRRDIDRTTTPGASDGGLVVATVVFVDVVESTAIFEGLDPEDVHTIMNGCFEVLLDEVHRFEGRVNHFRGDCAVALFSEGEGDRHHALRACHAALNIRDALTTYRRKIHLDYRIQFQVRIGIHPHGFQGL